MTVLDDPRTFFGSDAIQDPYPVYGRMRREGPVHRIGDSEFYAVCTWDTVVEALTRVEDFSSNLTATMVFGDDGIVSPFPMGLPGDPMHALATADDPVHAAHRRILVPHLSARRVAAIEEFAEHVVERLFNERLCGNRIEWMGSIANRLPMMVVTRLLGLPDDDVDDLIRLGYATTTLLDGIVTPTQLETAGAAVLELSAYVMKYFDEALAKDGPGLIGDLGRRHASGELDQIAALGIMLTLFSAAGESTASLLGSAVEVMATQPDIQRRLRDDPGLLPAFIEETLRYESPFRGHYRHVRDDTTPGGVTLPANSHLLLLWGAANHDPAKFDEPEIFRLDRDNAKGHMAFGRGVHFCVGAALARLEARIVLRHLIDKTTWIEPCDVGYWLPSILVRRLDHLLLEIS